MKSLLLVPLILAVGLARDGHWSGKSTWPSESICYTEPDLGGTHAYFAFAAWNLSDSYVDNDIESVNQTGMWIYYENYNYNGDEPGLVYFIHGIDIVVNFPDQYKNVMSSLRSPGSYYSLNGNKITLYDGTSFTGSSYALEHFPYHPRLSELTVNVSSLIVTGTSPWTIYTGEDYTGYYWCVYATEHDTGSNGEVFDVGLFPSVEDAGIPDNSIKSLRIGCWGERVAKAPELKVDGRQKNGAWGRLQ